MPPNILIPLSVLLFPSSPPCLSRSVFCVYAAYTLPALTIKSFILVKNVVSGMLKDSCFRSGTQALWVNISPSISSPELRKGNVSSLSLSPSGPGAVVPRSNRDVPLPVSGKRGKRDCMA